MTADRGTALASDPAFAALADLVIDATGLAYYRGKEAMLAERVQERLAATGARGCGEYLRLLRSEAAGREELDALVIGLTVGETYFFRHREMFEAIERRVLPDVLRRNRARRTLRIWSAGASIGAEAYSVNVVLRQRFAAEIRSWRVEIVGTDINRRFLERAQQARYEAWTLREVPDEVRAACFRRDGQSWILTEPYRCDVHFQYHNLVEHPAPSLPNDLAAFDVILCRNVLIYFDRAVARRIVARLRECLVDGGWLLVGHAEPASDVFAGFRALHEDGVVLYQRPGADAASDVPAPWAPPAADVARSLAPPGGTHPAPGGSAAALPVPAVDPRRLPAVPGERPGAAVPALDVRLSAATGVPASTAVDLAEIRRLANRGEHLQALAGCERLHEAASSAPELHLTEAMLLIQVGRTDEAVQSLRRALYLDQRAPLPHYILGLACLRQGRRGEAIRSFTNVLGLLATVPPGDPIPDGDGLTAADLDRLARMQMEVAQR